jgi:hypothetical protein
MNKNLLSTFSLRFFKKIMSYLSFREMKSLSLVSKNISERVFIYCEEDMENIRIPHLNDI